MAAEGAPEGMHPDAPSPIGSGQHEVTVVLATWVYSSQPSGPMTVPSNNTQSRTLENVFDSVPA
jgi:hypothetical protein